MYQVTLEKYWKVKESKVYLWPCKSNPNRMIKLFLSDVLTIDTDGTVISHIGLCRFGIKVPIEDLIEINNPTSLIVG